MFFILSTFQKAFKVTLIILSARCYQQNSSYTLHIISMNQIWVWSTLKSDFSQCASDFWNPPLEVLVYSWTGWEDFVKWSLTILIPNVIRPNHFIKKIGFIVKESFSVSHPIVFFQIKCFHLCGLYEQRVHKMVRVSHLWITWCITVSFEQNIFFPLREKLNAFCDTLLLRAIKIFPCKNIRQ